MTITKQHQDLFLTAVLDPAPSPGVPLGTARTRRALRVPAGTVTRNGKDRTRWERYYRARYERRLQVPSDWLSFWVALTEMEPLVAWHRLQHLLATLAADPAAQDLTAAEAVSALCEGLLKHRGLDALRRPSVLAQVIADAH